MSYLEKVIYKSRTYKKMVTCVFVALVLFALGCLIIATQLGLGYLFIMSVVSLLWCGLTIGDLVSMWDRP